MNTKLLPLADRFHSAYTNILSYAQHPLLLLIRLYWGYDFFQTGMGKLTNLDRTIEFFTSLGIPFPHLNAIAAGSTELVCGVLLMIGFGSRYFTLPLIVIMCVAYATDDHEALMNIFLDTASFVAAAPFNHLLASLIILVFGAGTLSVDEAIRRFRKTT